MRTAPFHDVELHVDDLAEFVFRRNVNNVPLELSLGGIENNKDLFFFCLDLFCKGLVLTRGDGQTVNLEDISMEDFTTIKTKMVCAGIEPTLQVFPSDVDTVSEIDLDENGNQIKRNKLNIDELNAMDDSSPIESFLFRVTNIDMTYVVSFKIVHNIQ